MRDDEFDYRISELERRVLNMVRVGTIIEADHANARVRVQIDEIETDWLMWFTHRAGGDVSWHAPEVGEQVMVFAPSGDLAQGICLPSIYSTAHAAPAASADITRTVWADGLVVEHDRAEKLTRLNALDSEGTLVLEAKNIVIRTGDGGYYHLDHHGKASRITHIDGVNFETDAWSTGAVVTGNPDQGYSPPEVLSDEEEED